MTCCANVKIEEKLISVPKINTLKYYPDRCINCLMCLAVCPHTVFGAGETCVEMINGEACMECGACQMNCPAGAISVDSGVGCAAAMFKAALSGQKLEDWGDNTQDCCG
ncbi:MAG: 4Fe-4S binding protein [Anaerolineaceae bacterium]|nr:4Fe-4S binding protein [Anaerolineaceae bacterium]